MNELLTYRILKSLLKLLITGGLGFIGSHLTDKLSNKNNEIDKKDFIEVVSWIKDYRTWNKYWTELVEKGVLIQVDKDIWMVSPHECYADGASHTTLINKWNEVRNAIN